MQIRRRSITHPDAVLLVGQVQQVYVGLYGSPDESAVDAEEFAGVEGAFYVGYLDGRPVASGAWRRCGIEALGTSATAEVKRMYVVENMQHRGLARQMLAHLESHAAAAGYEAMVLETGSVQPAAIALYESSGYRPVPGFGHYRDEPLSRSFARRLADVSPSTERTERDPAAGGCGTGSTRPVGGG